MTSGKPAWTFNAAGLHHGTVGKYGAEMIGSAKNIQAYRVEGELLTTLQEVNNESDYELIRNALPDALQKPWGVALPFTLKEWSSLAVPDAAGIPHTLAGGTGTLLDKHGIDQTIKLIEDQKDEDVATIRGEYEQVDNGNGVTVYCSHDARMQKNMEYEPQDFLKAVNWKSHS